MLGKSVRVKSKLQEKKESGEEKEKIQPLSFFFPFHIIYVKWGGFCYDGNIFGIFRHCCDRLMGMKAQKKTKSRPINK